MIGDIVKAFDGKVVEDASQLENAIYGLALAESVNLDLLRDGKTVTVTVPVHEREDDPMRFADMVNPEDNLDFQARDSGDRAEREDRGDAAGTAARIRPGGGGADAHALRIPARSSKPAT